VAIKGTATGMARNVDRVQLASGLYLADITDAVGVTSWDFRVGAVAEFTFPAVDRGRELSRRGLLREGVTLKWDGENWQIAVVERDYKGDDIWLNFTARSRLARRLRNMGGDGKAVKKETPQSFIGRAVKKAGGAALVEPGAGRVQIVQKRGESVLDVIGNIASDTGVEWVEHGNTFYVGTPWWAFKEDLGLPTWAARADGTVTDIGSNVLSVLTLSTRSSLDDRKNAAEAQLTVEAATGAKVRPWHKVNLSRAADADDGLWLVSDVTFDEVSGSADLSLVRPLKSSPKKGSTPSSDSSQLGSDGTSATIADLDDIDGWIKGYDKVWPRCSRTPKQAVAWALVKAAPPNNTWGQRLCLNFVSQAFGKNNLGGGQASFVWDKAPASAIKSPGDTSPPAGALVVWGVGAGQGAGHIGISIGGGKMVNASGGRVFIASIAGFTSDYKGAMTPSFWTGG